MDSLCQLIYEPFETKCGMGIVLTRCVPNDGVSLYEIQATYAKQIPSTKYYFLGRTEKEARSRFQNTLGSWMTITSVRLIPPGDEAEHILTDRLRMPKR